MQATPKDKDDKENNHDKTATINQELTIRLPVGP